MCYIILPSRESDINIISIHLSNFVIFMYYNLFLLFNLYIFYYFIIIILILCFLEWIIKKKSESVNKYLSSRKLGSPNPYCWYVPQNEASRVIVFGLVGESEKRMHTSYICLHTHAHRQRLKSTQRLTACLGLGCLIQGWVGRILKIR